MNILSPDIDSVKVSFIKPFTLPNFTKNLNMLNQKFGFLSNSYDYSQYYKNLERGSIKKKIFQEISQLGHLESLRKDHTLTSYWRFFRYNELFLLLPLKIIIPIKSVKVEGTKFPVNVYVYLFSFGSGCINMEIDIKKKYSLDDLDELSKLIAKLKTKSILCGGKSFEPFSESVSSMLNRELFGEEGDVFLFHTHNFIFYQNASGVLTAGYNKHEKVIAAVMMEKAVADLSGMSEELIDQKIQCRLKPKRNGEILFFNPKSTFIYPSPKWINELKQKGKDVDKKLDCMCDNYRSFLNVIFAVNRFLSDSFIEYKDKLDVDRRGEIVKCFTTAFPDVPSNSSTKFYFKHAFEPIAKQIKLSDNLNTIR